MDLIKILEILPKTNRSGYILQKKELEGGLLVSYKTLGKGKKHIFPKNLALDEEFFIGFSLSVGDGLNNPSIQNTHYNFSNKNFKLVQIVYSWLIKYFNIEEKDIQFQLFSKDKNNSDSIQSIVNLFKINKDKIRIYPSNRHRECTLVIQISNKIFQLVYLKLFDLLKNKIINNSNLRRAFLKGLFAAEGHMKHSVYGTIESVSFSFNPKLELELANFIQRCLLKEDITAKNNGKGAIYFCGYENMLKFYLLDIMGLYEKKKDKFLRLIKNSKFSLHFKKKSLDFLRENSQYKLARILNCSQSGVCKMLKGNFLSLGNLDKLENINLLNKKQLFKKIEFIGVSTSFIKDKSSIEFLEDKIITNSQS